MLLKADELDLLWREVSWKDGGDGTAGGGEGTHMNGREGNDPRLDDWRGVERRQTKRLVMG